MADMRGNDFWIIKYRTAGVGFEAIAEKLGMGKEEVEKRWVELVDQYQNNLKTGQVALAEQFTILCHQYQLLGESLKIVAKAFGDSASNNEVQKCIDSGDVRKAAERVLAGFIVIRPFTPEDPGESLERELKKQQAGN